MTSKSGSLSQQLLSAISAYDTYHIQILLKVVRHLSIFLNVLRLRLDVFFWGGLEVLASCSTRATAVWMAGDETASLETLVWGNLRSDGVTMFRRNLTDPDLSRPFHEVSVLLKSSWAYIVSLRSTKNPERSLSNFVTNYFQILDCAGDFSVSYSTTRCTRLMITR